jgi:hypothetical protein
MSFISVLLPSVGRSSVTLLSNQCIIVPLHAMNAYYGVLEVYCCSFLTWALDAVEWLASQTHRFTPVERDLGFYQIEGCVGPRAGQDALEKKKICNPYRQSNQYSSVVHPVAESLY